MDDGLDGRSPTGSAAWFVSLVYADYVIVTIGVEFQPLQMALPLLVEPQLAVG